MQVLQQMNSSRPGLQQGGGVSQGKKSLSMHAPSLIQSLSIHYYVSTTHNRAQYACNSTWIGHCELQRDTKPTTTKQLEYRTPLKSMSVSKQRKKNPTEKPFRLLLYMLIMQQSFLIMQAAYEIVWWQKARTRWPSHGWCYERIRNEFTPTQPKKQFKVAGTYQQRNGQPTFRKENCRYKSNEQKNNGISTSYFALCPQHMYLSIQSKHQNTRFPLHTLPKMTMQMKDIRVVNHQSIRKETKTTLSPLPSHPCGSGPGTCRKTATIPHSVRKANAKPEVSTRLQGERWRISKWLKNWFCDAWNRQPTPF